ncbi:MAG TPA: hypothetical protein DD381_04350 [Lentisphaeria bacterium]|nr:MAG: hypothetical protein A2X47_07300 [Lentisphaerae bacterium GWF2_38_69]HBM15563.1 hypothetical protein [Lentisphaeria bacterium]
MDFFAHQDRARRNTVLLIIYYIITVILIIGAIYVVFAAVFLGEYSGLVGEKPFRPQRMWNIELFLAVAGATLLIVITGTIYKIIQLSSGGGSSVATMLGGIQISHGTNDSDERKILNIVEEMAIASGLPVPPVYIMNNEASINAFAAGFSHDHAVIGVTRGCIKKLKRDELQGVIAHEFSHILNGDMRLNIKLIGVLNGILIIAMMGYWIMRSTRNSSSSGKKKGGTPLPLLGLLIWVVGYIGVFFGNIIKSAVSRQREFLADASSVQFTRNPDGIAGALKKISSHSMGSKVLSSNAQEVSHMFFANGIHNFWGSLFATHPPIEERINRITGISLASKEIPFERVSQDSLISTFSKISDKDIRIAVNPTEVIRKVGTLTQENLLYASSIHSGIPEEIKEALYDSYGAISVIYAMLLEDDATIRNFQLLGLKNRLEGHMYDQTFKLYEPISKIWLGFRLPILDMALPLLKTLTVPQYKDFRNNLDFLIKADNKISLFEYCVGKILTKNLDPIFNKTKIALVKYKDITLLIPRCEELLSCLAYWNAVTADAANEIFEKASEKLSVGNLTIRPSEECNLTILDNSLNELALASPMVKKLIFEGCISCIIADNEIKIEEAELLRAIGSMLDCPVPPFFTLYEKKR